MADSRSDEETLNLYANIMEEVKIRFDAINTIALNPQMTIAPIRREMAFLQLRMICELVALGCLVAHGDIQATSSSDMRKAYAADLIIKLLEDLHPDFFPHAHKLETRGAHNHHLADKDEPFMTKAEFIALVRKCGSVLHRGNLKKLMKPTVTIPNNLPDVFEPGMKLIKLLETHHIFRRDGRIIVCMLNDHNGRVSTGMAEPPRQTN